MAAGDLTTLAAVKAFLDLTVTTQDTLLSSWITRMSVWAQHTAMQRVFTSSSYIKKFMGTGQSTWMFPEYPVSAVASVVIGTTTLVADRDYWFDENQLTLLNGWAFMRGAICTITFTAGYATIPADVDQATVELVAFLYRQRDRIDQSSKSLGGSETVSFITDPSTKRAIAVLEAYRKVFPG